MEYTGQPSWDVESSIRLAKLLPSLGVDALDISSGGNHSKQKIVNEAPIHAKFSRQVRKALHAEGLHLPIALVGGITEAEVARSVLDNNGKRQTNETIEVATEHGQVAEADLVLAGRQFLREPEWVLRVAHELKVPVKWPNQYMRAGPSGFSRHRL
jgi:2,4-dienoyl-CoA reductase-like NADH-dependent reductase (Old Yellow Enzyme family)